MPKNKLRAAKQIAPDKKHKSEETKVTQSDLDAAIEEYKKLSKKIKNPDEEVIEIEVLLEAAASLFDCALNVGYKALKLHQYDCAAEYYNYAIGMYDENWNDEELKANIRFNLGKVYRKKKEMTLSLENYNAVKGIYKIMRESTSDEKTIKKYAKYEKICKKEIKKLNKLKNPQNSNENLNPTPVPHNSVEIDDIAIYEIPQNGNDVQTSLVQADVNADADALIHANSPQADVLVQVNPSEADALVQGKPLPAERSNESNTHIPPVPKLSELPVESQKGFFNFLVKKAEPLSVLKNLNPQNKTKNNSVPQNTSSSESPQKTKEANPQKRQKKESVEKLSVTKEEGDKIVEEFNRKFDEIKPGIHAKLKDKQVDKKTIKIEISVPGISPEKVKSYLSPLSRKACKIEYDKVVISGYSITALYERLNARTKLQCSAVPQQPSTIQATTTSIQLDVNDALQAIPVTSDTSQAQPLAITTKDVNTLAQTTTTLSNTTVSRPILGPGTGVQTEKVNITQTPNPLVLTYPRASAPQLVVTFENDKKNNVLNETELAKMNIEDLRKMENELSTQIEKKEEENKNKLFQAIKTEMNTHKFYKSKIEELKKYLSTKDPEIMSMFYFHDNEYIKKSEKELQNILTQFTNHSQYLKSMLEGLEKQAVIKSIMEKQTRLEDCIQTGNQLQKRLT